MINIEHPRARRALKLAKKLSARRMSEFEDSPPSLTKSYPSIRNIATGEVKHPRAQKALQLAQRFGERRRSFLLSSALSVEKRNEYSKQYVGIRDPQKVAEIRDI